MSKEANQSIVLDRKRLLRCLSFKLYRTKTVWMDLSLKSLTMHLKVTMANAKATPNWSIMSVGAFTALNARKQRFPIQVASYLFIKRSNIFTYITGL